MELESTSLDKIHVECESASIIPQENSCYVVSSSSSARGSGLDSDFGASAGQFADSYEWIKTPKVQSIFLKVHAVIQLPD